MSKSLVIVESPTKARTIKKFLPAGHIVEASVGHIRDLPAKADQIPKKYKKEAWSRLGVNVEKNFEALYVVPPTSKPQVKKLKELLAECDTLYLATDEDREGEAISWHLLELLKPKVPTKRLVFHEITKSAIKEALETPRELDESLVSAQETRRILDRLYGYSVSPVLWRNVGPKLSAGRVQSVTTRLIVDREKERMKFVRSEFWDLTGSFKGGEGPEFDAVLSSIDGKRIARGKDFDADTGLLSNKEVAHIDKAKAAGCANTVSTRVCSLCSSGPVEFAPQGPSSRCGPVVGHSHYTRPCVRTRFAPSRGGSLAPATGPGIRRRTSRAATRSGSRRRAPRASRRRPGAWRPASRAA